MSKREFVEQNFHVIWPVHFSNLLELLLRLRSTFDGDLDLMLIFSVIAQRVPEARWRNDLVNSDRLTAFGKSHEQPLPINVFSISESCLIPRETVRRKVKLLERKGWVLRHPDGRLSILPQAGVDLEEATGHSIDFIASLLLVHEATEVLQSGG